MIDIQNHIQVQYKNTKIKNNFRQSCDFLKFNQDAYVEFIKNKYSSKLVR